MQRFRVITATLGLAVLLGASGCITMPGSAGAKVHEVTFTAMETEIVVDGNGTKYKAWTFNGQMPGPVVRVTEGDTVNFTLIGDKNNSFPHSMDFHAAELDFLKNYHKTVSAGETHRVFLSSRSLVCFTLAGASPMIQHVARGMFGAVVVDPKDVPMPGQRPIVNSFWSDPNSGRTRGQRAGDV